MWTVYVSIWKLQVASVLTCNSKHHSIVGNASCVHLHFVWSQQFIVLKYNLGAVLTWHIPHYTHFPSHLGTSLPQVLAKRRYL